VGTSKGKWGTLLETLLEFKRLYDGAATVAEVLPELAAKHPERYGSMTLKALCDEMHAQMRRLNLPGLLHEACDFEPVPALSPAETYQKLVRYQTEKLRVSEMAHRIAGAMLVPYPPGIPILMPGERLGEAASATIRFLLALEEYGRRFPGFEHEVHGIETDHEGNFWMRSVIEKPGAARAATHKARPRLVSRSGKKGRW
jgi:arginine decarboxylase